MGSICSKEKQANGIENIKKIQKKIATENENMSTHEHNILVDTKISKLETEK